MIKYSKDKKVRLSVRVSENLKTKIDDLSTIYEVTSSELLRLLIEAEWELKKRMKLRLLSNMAVEKS